MCKIVLEFLENLKYLKWNGLSTFLTHLLFAVKHFYPGRNEIRAQVLISVIPSYKISTQAV
jgi:hypothetical protein